MPKGIYKRKPFTEEHKKNMRKSRTEKHRKNISISLIGNQYAKGCKHTEKMNKEKSERTKGKNHPFYGKKHTEETKNKIRNSEYHKNLSGEIKKQQWQNGVFDGVFQSPTQPEKEIMKILKSLGINYIFQFRPEGYSKVYDFYIPNMNLLIEFDSKYWHSLKENKLRDKEKTKYANDNGYKLLRINEENLDNLIEVL